MQAKGIPQFGSIFRRNRTVLRGGVAAIILIAGIVAQLILTHLHEEAEERAATVTQNLTQSVEQTINGMIDTIDVALLASADEINRRMSAGKVDADSVTRFLVRQTGRLRNIAFVRAANERGEVIYGPGIPSPPANNSDREYFIRLRDNSNAGLFVAKPIIGRIAQKWLWTFARRINKPDGSFGGVVFASIYLDELEKMLSQIKLEPGSVISIRDSELGLIARSTPDAINPVPPGDKRLSNAFREALKANPREGTFISDKTTPDSISRTYSYRRNQGYGFMVNVGLARDPMLTEWRYQTWIAVTLVGSLTLLVLLVSRLIDRTWRRQEDDLARLEASEMRFRAIIEAAPVACALNDNALNITYLNASFTRTFGYTLEDIPNLTTWWSTAYPDPVYRQWITETWQTRLHRSQVEGAPFEQLEANVRCKNGTVRTALFGAAAVGTAFENLHLVTCFDITERKHLEQEREQYFRFFELTTDAMCIADPFGCFKRVNPSFVRMTGFAVDELIAKPFLDFVLPEDRQKTTEEMKLQVAVRPSMYFENRYVCKDGKIITLSWTAYYDKTDGVTYATARDITELRQAEDRLERYFTLAPDLMCIASTSGNFLKINPAWQALLGYSEQEILATPFIDFVHPEDKAATQEAGTRQLTGETILNFVNRYRCKDGSYRWLEWRTTQAINQVFIYATARDITERMRMEAALQESEARFRQMFEKHDSVMLLIDPGSGEIIDANAAAARFYGYSIEQLQIMRIDQINTLPAEETAAKRAQAVQHEHNVFVFPHRLASGKVRTVEVRSSPVEITGRILLFSVVNDVTEREIATAELKRSNAELEQFSYAVSHDMRQPLRMISSYLQLLEAALVEQLDDEKREFFDFAIDGAKRLDKMLVALLEYSRVGRMGEPPSWVESRNLRDETLLLLQPMISEAKAVVHIEGEWPRVFVSPDEILRLLQNLIGNALKFRVAGRMPEITLSSEASATEWRLRVADNGVGIIPDQIGRLFQVFQRLQARTAYEGTGVGLALCRKIAEHHGGRIWAESAGAGQGSRFCVTLPMRTEAEK